MKQQYYRKMAIVEAGHGNVEKALSHLENVLRVRQIDVVDIRKEPVFATLRLTRQYRELMERHGTAP